MILSRIGIHLSLTDLSMVGRSRSIGRFLVHRFFMLGSFLSISIDNLNTHLLGEGEFNSLASRGSQLGHTLLKGLSNFLNLRDSDALLFREILTGDPGKADGLVDTGLDGFRVGDINSRLNRGDNRDIVASLLGNLLAVVVSIASIPSISSRLADSHHLGLTLLLEGDLNSLGGGGLSLGLVGVGADLIVNLLSGLRADGSGDSVALLSVNDILSGQLNRLANCLKGRGAHLSGLNNILNRAVVLGVLITVAIGWGMVVSRSYMAISWGWVTISGGRVAIGRSSLIPNVGKTGYKGN